MDKNTIVLVGQTNSGKTTVAKLLEAYGYKRIVTYTTRPKRQGERDGIDYNFVTDEKFKSMIKMVTLQNIQNTMHYLDMYIMVHQRKTTYLMTKR